ncbi:MAG: hypothetical protein HFJ34_01325 [Clostridia bacterium]|nr:hypothetical protein [Clostridia bacterium]
MKYKSEKGSVTLFVTLSCFFIVMMLAIYVMNVENKKQAQNKEIEQIMRSYEIDEQDMEKVYSKIVNENQ